MLFKWKQINLLLSVNSTTQLNILYNKNSQKTVCFQISSLEYY